MGWRRTDIEVTSTIDLGDYDDEIMDYVEPDNIIDAMEMMERWGYGEGDILAHLIEEPDALLSKLADILTVESALDLVKSVYQYGDTVRIRNMSAKDNQIAELKQKVDDLLALNHTVIKDQEQIKQEDAGYGYC